MGTYAYGKCWCGGQSGRLGRASARVQWWATPCHNLVCSQDCTVLAQLEKQESIRSTRGVMEFGGGVIEQNSAAGKCGDWAGTSSRGWLGAILHSRHAYPALYEYDQIMHNQSRQKSSRICYYKLASTPSKTSVPFLVITVPAGRLIHPNAALVMSCTNININNTSTSCILRWCHHSKEKSGSSRLSPTQQSPE